MITIKFKECCMNCVQVKTYTDENKAYALDKVFLSSTTIGCEHEEVCKKYIDDTDELQRTEETYAKALAAMRLKGE